MSYECKIKVSSSHPSGISLVCFQFLINVHIKARECPLVRVHKVSESVLYKFIIGPFVSSQLFHINHGHIIF